MDTIPTSPGNGSSSCSATKSSGAAIIPRATRGGRCFVLGDNRDNSADSRYWGFVDASAVKGRPLVVYFSYDRATRDALPWLTDIRWSRLGSLIH
ncbi:MAG: hypothetical protein DMD66_04410 [Gemmatimonadetes bacterium]|nr:MAG: hypothetical protein DMD66_04410 [Gemmatimonadota bacterium]